MGFGVKIEFYNNDKKSEIKYSCQEFNPSNREKEIEEGYPADDIPDVDKLEEIKPLKSEQYYRKKGWKGLTPATPRKSHFHKNYFVPFFVNDKGFNPKKFYKLSTQNLSERKYIYIKPLYDGLYGEYGNLCAILQMLFKDKSERDKLFEEKEDDEKRKIFIKCSGARNILINRLPSLVNEIKNAALFEIFKQPIENDDLLEHYIKWLPMLQDWEKVMVWKIKEDKSDAGICYCYTRRVEGGKETKWRKCENGKIEGGKPNNKDCKLCKNSKGNPYYKKLERWVFRGKKKSILIAGKEFKDKPKHSKFKSLLEKIFTKELIPELEPEDEAKYKDIRLIYKYPPYTIFPDDETKNHRLAIFYERQQIDILRQLALKQKVLKESIKSAVAAIMSRNHSHHIGSHVIPRTFIAEIQKRWSSPLNKENLKIIKTSLDKPETQDIKY